MDKRGIKLLKNGPILGALAVDNSRFNESYPHVPGQIQAKSRFAAFFLWITLWIMWKDQIFRIPYNISAAMLHMHFENKTFRRFFDIIALYIPYTPMHFHFLPVWIITLPAGEKSS